MNVLNRWHYKKKLLNDVQDGIDWLNDIRPGWFNQINLAKLDLASTCNCVLGQLPLDTNLTSDDNPSEFGDWLISDSLYERPTKDLLTLDTAVRYGFTSLKGSTEFNTLTSIWRREIADLQDAYDQENNNG